ncbi:DUF4835 family protein [Ferruginibacter yonginensis]|uniref:DUF4835 family protein n=1 Tax=Ferruginibacter yonginensis TaxID=1310416 RepID=A0ABV8QPG6_9BACT
MQKIVSVIIFTVASFYGYAQELNARVTVSAAQVNNTVNKNTFLTLQNALNNFLNNRKWSKDAYAPNEKIDCTFFLNIQSTEELNVYSGSLTIQVARPVYNTNYLSPIINFKDDDIIFKYIEFQQLEFNDNRVTGSDAQLSNLTAIFAYYANMIIAFDNESFAIRGGEANFLKAQNIVNNAPDGRGIKGWKAFDGIRNRYWLVDNMLNTRYAIMNDVYYNYYRLGLDKLYDDENTARSEIINVLNQLAVFNNENPNTMINQFFFQGKSNELIKVFSKALPQDKAKAIELLTRLDVTNANNYKEGLK